MILKREFKKNLKALLIWSVVLGGFILMMLSIYPQMAAEQESMQELLKAYPENLQKIFGMDRLNFGTILGFFAVEVYFMTTLFGSIYVAMLASNIIAKEENEKTIEFLLSRPITRTQILLQKLGAVVLNILIINIVFTVTSLLGFQFSEDADVPLKTFLLLMIATFLLHLTFVAISFMLSAIMKKTRTIIACSLAIVFISYFFSVIAGLSEKLEGFKYVSLFKYVDAADIIFDNRLNPLFTIIMIVLTITNIAAAFIFYKRKDIAV